MKGSVPICAEREKNGFFFFYGWFRGIISAKQLLYHERKDLICLLYTSHHLSGFSFFLFHGEDHVAPHHQTGNFLLGDVGGVVNAHGFSAPHDGQTIGDLFDLFEFVGDKDNGVALFFQMNKLAEELGGLLKEQGYTIIFI